MQQRLRGEYGYLLALLRSSQGLPDWCLKLFMDASKSKAKLHSQNEQSTQDSTYDAQDPKWDKFSQSVW